jgi:hypothetical protein
MRRAGGRLYLAPMRTRPLVCTLLVFAATASTADAATVSVPAGSLDSNAGCSASPCPNLRSAIAYANANASTTISLAAGTYALTLGELDITTDTTITGQGMSATKIQQTDGASRVLEIGAGSTVSLQALEITGGTARPPEEVVAEGYGGGGILDNGASLTLDHVLLDHNQVLGTDGVGVNNNDANGVHAYGGGIDIPSHATGSLLTITNSTISDNTAQGGNGGSATIDQVYDAGFGGQAFGGGIFVGQKGTLDVTGSTLSGNRALGGAGGDILVNSATTGPGNAGVGGFATGGAISGDLGVVTLSGDTLNANAAIGGAPGGDIYSGAHVGTGGDGLGGAFAPGAGTSGMSPLVIENSTLTGNSAAGGSAPAGSQGGGPAGGGAGGALHLIPGNVTIESSTLDGNTATGDVGTFPSTGTGGGNIDITGTTLKLQATIIAGGTATTGGGNCRILFPQITTINDSGNNLESSSPTQCGLTGANGDVIGGTPALGALADNGGPTKTMALGAGSQALNAGGYCGFATDQRGFPRPNSMCDIGAFQHQGAVVKTADAVISGTPAVGQTLSCTGAMFSGDGLTLSYAWLRNGSPIPGATAASYKLVDADGGTKVSCQVTATGGAGTATSTSAAVTVTGGGGSGGGKPGAPSFPSQKLVAAANGSVAVTISCSSGSSACTGTLELTVTKVGSAFVARAGSRKAKRRVIVIASGRFTIQPGRKGTVKLHLTKLGRGLLRSRPHGLAVTLRVVQHAKTTTTKRTKLRAAGPAAHR